jgi:hypothetical protein
MTWLKLTTKALYWMESSSDRYLAKIDLKEHNPAKKEFKLSVPIAWFQGANAPGKMIIELSPSHPEPLPLPRPNALKILDEVISTKDWQAESVSAGLFPRTNPKYIVIHHTAHGKPALMGSDINPPKDTSGGIEAGAKKLAQKFQHDHIDGNRWSDSGHNFLNTTGGFLLEGRHGSLAAIIEGQCVRSAHAAQDPGKLAHGNESPGIENEGNFMSFQMVDKQWKSLVALCAAICKSCDIDPSMIRGHRDFSATACPGDWLYDQLDKLRAEVRKLL